MFRIIEEKIKVSEPVQIPLETMTMAARRLDPFMGSTDGSARRQIVFGIHSWLVMHLKSDEVASNRSESMSH
jgi:hypothetical protein